MTDSKEVRSRLSYTGIWTTMPPVRPVGLCAIVALALWSLGCSAGEESVVDERQDSVVVTAPDPTSFYVVRNEMKKGNVAILREYLDVPRDLNGGHPGESLLYVASEQRNLEMVQMLLAAGADPNFKGTEKFSALNSAVFIQDAEMVEVLLDARADPDEDILGIGVTHMIQCRTPEILSLLLQHGGDPYFVSSDGVNSLTQMIVGGLVANVKVLLDYGIDPNIGGEEHPLNLLIGLLENKSLEHDLGVTIGKLLVASGAVWGGADPPTEGGRNLMREFRR